MEDMRQQSWPKAYYEENDRELRKKLLTEQMQANPGQPEDELRLKLWELRYAPQGRKNPGQQVDTFIGGWMEMNYLSKNNGGLFGFGYVTRELKKTLKKMGFTMANEYGEAGREVLYQEICHLCRFYYHICATDRAYGTRLMGMVSMKDEDIVSKIAKEVSQNAYRLPRNARLEKEMELFTRAATQAFYDTFPGEREKLDIMIEKI